MRPEVTAEVTQHLLLVDRMARRLHRRIGSSAAAEDLIGAGRLGLVEALDRYDPAKNSCFFGYARLRIRGAMLDELRRGDPLTRGQRRRQQRVERAKRRLQATTGREVSDAALAASLGVSEKELMAERTQTPIVVMPMSAVASADGTDFEAGDEHGRDEASLLAHRDLRAALAKLTPRERTILESHYYEDRTLADIGRQLGLSENRVCQLERDALAKLRPFFSTTISTSTTRKKASP